MLIRVRKIDVQKDSFIKPDALDTCLDYWSTWMGQDDSDLGIKNQAGLQGEGDGYGNDDTGEQRQANLIAVATDAMINSLKAHERWAIFRRCGISQVWNFPSLNFFEALPKAEESLIAKLKINIVTSNLF